MAGTRVMLADNSGWNEEKVQRHLDEVGYLIQQPKIDGMRVFVGDDCTPLSRSGKPWKQRHLRKFFGDYPSLRYSDGEVVSGLQYDPTSFRESMSGIRAEDGSPEFTYYIFDYAQPDWALCTYESRRMKITTILNELGAGTYTEEGNGYVAKLILCPQTKVTSLEEIYALEIEHLAAGWEGSIIRRDDRAYKFGRSTINEGALLKLKRFEDAEAIVVGYEPVYENHNEAFTGPLGFTNRSAHQENLRPIDRLGVLQVELLTDRSVKFGIGVFRGLTHSDRDGLWVARETLIGRICKFKHQGYGGGYDKPRTPVWLGWRSPIDL